jgi:N-acetylglucosaminyldiphosphoundecaprenol N-acetyl-beta-D-mannosaminyltransferase
MKDEAPHTKGYNILRIRFDLITYETVIEAIEHWRAKGESHYVTITNPHSVMLCHRDKKMREATTGAALTMPDGVGIIIAANILGYKSNGRVTGPTLMLKVCDWGRKYGYRHFLYGGAKGIAERLAVRLSNIYPGLKVVGTYCPPFRHLSAIEDEDIVKKINATKPDIIWVSLGAPKQEKWMAAHLSKVHATAMIGVGAAFDFHSGNIKWSPPWVRKIGIEWAYRLAQNPRRMWRRNLDSPIFLTKVVCQRLRMLLNGRPAR